MTQITAKQRRYIEFLYDSREAPPRLVNQDDRDSVLYLTCKAIALGGRGPCTAAYASEVIDMMLRQPEQVAA